MFLSYKIFVKCLVFCNFFFFAFAGVLVQKILQNMDDYISNTSSYNVIAYSAVSLLIICASGSVFTRFCLGLRPSSI